MYINFQNIPKVPAVYELQIDGYFYIGSTNNLYRRLVEHNKALSLGKHENKVFQEMVDSATFKQLQLVYTPYPEDVDMKEVRAEEERRINFNLDNPKMVNCTVDNNPMYGLTTEAKEAASAKLSDSLKRYWDELPPAIKEQRRANLIAALDSRSDKAKAEHRAKLSEARRLDRANRSWSDEKERRRKIGVASKAQMEGKSEEELRKVTEAAWKATSMAVMADGVEYPSISACARALGLGGETIRKRIKSPSKKFEGFYLKEN